MGEKELSSEQCLILELLRQRWSERQDLSFGELIAQLVYLTEGHTESGYMKDEKFIKSVQQGWRTL